MCTPTKWVVKWVECEVRGGTHCLLAWPRFSRQETAVSAGAGVFSCTSCGKIFSYSCNLKIHMDSYHWIPISRMSLKRLCCSDRKQQSVHQQREGRVLGLLLPPLIVSAVCVLKVKEGYKCRRGWLSQGHMARFGSRQAHICFAEKFSTKLTRLFCEFVKKEQGTPL